MPPSKPVRPVRVTSNKAKRRSGGDTFFPGSPEGTDTHPFAETRPDAGGRERLREWVALVGILTVAVLLRVVDLGVRPLQPEEADLALRSWLLSRGEQAALGGNPLLVNANAALVFMLGSDDGVLRLLPALAGLAMVWLAWALWPWLGRTGALVAALLLAISPTACRQLGHLCRDVGARRARPRRRLPA